MDYHVLICRWDEVTVLKHLPMCVQVMLVAISL